MLGLRKVGGYFKNKTSRLGLLGIIGGGVGYFFGATKEVTAIVELLSTLFIFNRAGTQKAIDKGDEIAKQVEELIESLKKAVEK